jgi:hypothetical protein
VDELVHARGMGPNIHQKDAEDHVKRTKQMLAKVGDADSSVDNAAKVEQPGALPMAYDGAHPKESAMTPGEVRADIEKHVRRIAPPQLPPAEFLQRGKKLIGTQGRACLRWPGQRSCSWARSWARESLGGGDASIFHFPRAMAHKKTLSWLTRRYIEPFRRHILLSALLYLLILSYLIYPRSVLLLPPFSCGALEFEHVAR